MDSDLIIESREKQHHVHKILVCAASTFFEAACKGEISVSSPRHFLAFLHLTNPFSPLYSYVSSFFFSDHDTSPRLVGRT